jgi:DNA-binding protein YbaB
MSSSFDLGDLLRSPEELYAAQREQLAKAEELQRRIETVTGTATSSDERIAVSFSEANGVQDLVLDPRVLRMPSEDLAAEIVRLVNAARTEAHGQIQQVMNETLGDGGRPDPEQIGEQAAELQRSLDELMRDTMRMDGELTDVFDRMRRLGDE